MGKGTHGSISKAGKIRDEVNRSRGTNVTEHHTKKHLHPMVANRRKYEKMLKSRGRRK